MKKLALAFGFAVMAMFSVNAQTELKVGENPNAANMAFTKTTHDYGTIVKEANGECSFEFKNTGKEPLIISNAQGSCGCTVPTYSKEPILPGKTGAIKVKYDTKRIGDFTKTVTITSNAKNSPLVLTIKGKVIEKPGESAPVKPSEGKAPVAH